MDGALWNGPPPLAGHTAKASGKPPSWVIICFWPRGVCPQGLSVCGASSQKWGRARSCAGQALAQPGRTQPQQALILESGAG